MTIGRMKIEALKLMFLNARDLHEEELDELGADQNYSDYLAAMPGCIHRALQDMVVRRILPMKSREIVQSDGIRDGNVLRFSLRGIEDLFSVASVVCERDGIGSVRADFSVENEELLLYRPYDGWRYRVVYYPSLPEVSAATPNEMAPDIPEPLSAAIPYYIKGELFTTDTPSNAGEADRARAMYEAVLARYAQGAGGSRPARVKTVFGRW